MDIQGALNVIAYSTMTTTATAKNLDDASPAMDIEAGTVNGKRVRRALFTVEDQAMRWRADGTAPTSTEGHELVDTDILTLVGANYEELLKAIQFIKVSSDGKLKITFFD